MPTAHLAVTGAPLMARPVAAVPSMASLVSVGVEGVVGVLVEDPSLPPPPHADNKASTDAAAALLNTNDIETPRLKSGFTSQAPFNRKLNDYFNQSYNTKFNANSTEI
jgi:hypothetical protein